ncbi:hypothetical protein [Neglectibacter timonensis]|uniref:hypothetical protein n=1 Tax=Neglectibacter timonensis TaxID=1776382 RepID=UPI0039949C37
MYVAKFERYWNDYRRKGETKTFSGLAELENWMFGQMQQDYTKDFVMTFPTPAAAVRIKADGADMIIQYALFEEVVFG